MNLNSYEVLIIFKPIMDVENVDAILNHFQKNIVEANGGQIAETDRIGRKRLAYEIKKFKDGFLTLYLIKLPPAKVADFKRSCQLNEDVLRVTLVRQDELPTREPLTEARRDDGPRGGGDRGGFRGRREFSGPPRGGDRDRNDRGGFRGPGPGLGSGGPAPREQNAAGGEG